MPTDQERYMSAIAAMFEPVEQLAAEEGSDGSPGYVPPYGQLLSVAECPENALRYLGQFVGVTVPQGASGGEARALVAEHAGFNRGTLAALEGAIRRTLGPGVPFLVEERTNPKTAVSEAYWVTIIVPREAATAMLYAAINAVIPAGISYEVLEVANAWVAGGKKWSEVAGTVKWSSPPVEGEYFCDELPLDADPWRGHLNR